MNQEKTVEEPLLSQAKMNEYKEREFREYLVNQDVTLAIVKFLLALRNAPNKPDSPSQALIDYFSIHKDTRAHEEFEKLKSDVEQLEQENNQLSKEIDQIKEQIVQQKLEKQRREEEERVRLEEEAKKNTKKPTKK
ncbi:unnamed protein product [Paramecium pentaurelia]|uniref:Uncharacterized protein n=1 Tax=Paramecium pentaurelia TaxID=43138 RepID=A0A8S1TVG4_9CILI|nr:unnamed protein product [Paramecium pentaurelia]